MSDLLGLLKSPTGTTVKLVGALDAALDGNSVKAFPTLTSNVVVGVNLDTLVVLSDGEGTLDEVLERLMPDIVREAQAIIDETPPGDPFELAQNPHRSDDA